MRAARRRAFLVAVAVATVAVTGGALWLTRPGAPPSCNPWPEGTRCGPWRLAYTGFGSADASRQPGGWRIRLAPRPAELAGETHAGLAVGTQRFGDLDASATMTTVAQLRRPAANPWEVAWLVWHYTDDQHFYYVALKPNGWELGKEDPAYPGAQRYLATGSTPAFPIGRPYRARVRQVGHAITVAVDGRPLVVVRDLEHPYPSGAVGLYTEDAAVEFAAISTS